MPVKPKFRIENYILDKVSIEDEELFRDTWRSMENEKDFMFDGATRYPDQKLGLCWLIHDICYYYGGSKMDRLHADQLLRLMLQNRGKRFQAWLVYHGMRRAQRCFRRVNRLFHNHGGEGWKERIDQQIWKRSRYPVPK